MPYGTDGRYYPLIHPKRYPIKNQENEPMPKEPIYATEFAMLRDGEQEAYIGTLGRKGLLSLLFDHALELQVRLVAEQANPFLDPQNSNHIMPCGYCGLTCINPPADPTETLESMPAAEVAMSKKGNSQCST